MTAVRLPDLPGCVRGIVAVRPGPRGRNLYTLQCENCYETEEPANLVLMTFKFRNRHHGDNPRLCPPCRRAATNACICAGCVNDKGTR